MISIKYTCRGYRYAPESFRAYKVLIPTNGQPEYTELPFTAEQRTEIGNTYICKGEAAATALMKRLDRVLQRKQRLFITYGFMDASNPSQYHYTRQLYCKSDAPLKERGRIYLEFKDYLARGSEVTLTEYTLDEHYCPVGQKKTVDCYQVNADLAKPILVYLRLID